MKIKELKITKYDIRAWLDAFKYAYPNSLNSFTYKKLLELKRKTNKHSLLVSIKLYSKMILKEKLKEVDGK